ncbi:MAG: hypothetical protein O2788_00770 [Chloroflexi bacterium]|nr:hypothetical protein [Chloroflexota bacterium]
MAQLFIAIEENENSGSFPLRTFELLSSPQKYTRITVELPGPSGNIEVVGWCSSNGGTPCAAFVAIVSDEAAGKATRIYGGDQGVRIRQSGSTEPWSLASPGQHGAPFLQVDLDVRYRAGG